MRSRSWSPRVSSRAEFLICCKGHQYASPPKRIITLSWLDHREHGHQSRATVLFLRAARDGSSLGTSGGVLGCGEDMGRCPNYMGKSLGFIFSFRVNPRTN
jgi:hypothetical protein